jgi:mono/diheme cytochrome c family protein
MKKIAFLLLSMCFVFMLLRVSAQSGSENPPVAQQSKAGAHAKSAAPAEGERLFQQNCSRCHTKHFPSNFRNGNSSHAGPGIFERKGRARADAVYEPITGPAHEASSFPLNITS